MMRSIVDRAARANLLKVAMEHVLLRSLDRGVEDFRRIAKELAAATRRALRTEARDIGARRYLMRGVSASGVSASGASAQLVSAASASQHQSTRHRSG
jgi:hypothetical protein